PHAPPAEFVQHPRCGWTGAKRRRWRMKRKANFILILPSLILLTAFSLTSAQTNEAPRFSRGLSSDPNYFPIAVWLQDPSQAMRYKSAGINVYVGLWRG